MIKNLDQPKTKSKDKFEKIGKIEKITKSKKSHPGDGSWGNGVKGGNW